LFGPRIPRRDVVIAEARTERVVVQAKAAIRQADLALREVRRLDRAPQ